MRDTKEKFSRTTADLNWLVGPIIVSLLAVGIDREELEAYDLYPIHKSIGMRSFVIILGRAVRGLMNGLPATTADHEKSEHNLAVIVH